LIGQLTRLKSLTLRFYTEGVIETLSTSLTNLERLNIGNLSEVKENDTIEYTSGNGRELSDSTVHCLTRLTSLISLNLCGLRLTDDALGHLRSLTRLRTLDLTYCLKITDEGVNKLAPLTTLDHLELWRTKVSEEGIRKLIEKRKTPLTWNKSRVIKAYDT